MASNGVVYSENGPVSILVATSSLNSRLNQKLHDGVLGHLWKGTQRSRQRQIQA